jgi:hypothetical protein
MSRLAREYFKSLVADDHSFEKPTFYLGLDNWSVTNVLPDGAHARTPGRIELLPNGLSGFSKVGDMACFALDVSTREAASSCVKIRVRLAGVSAVHVSLVGSVPL